MAKSIDSRNCSSAHVARNPQGDGPDMTFRRIGSTSWLADQISARVGNAENFCAICNFIEYVDASQLARLLVKEASVRQYAA